GPPPFRASANNSLDFSGLRAENLATSHRHVVGSGPEPWRRRHDTTLASRSVENARRDRGGHGPGTAAPIGRGPRGRGAQAGRAGGGRALAGADLVEPAAAPNHG